MADFHVKLRVSIDETISSLLGKSVLETLHEYFIKEYDLTPDKIPYRLDTFVGVLDNVFGVPGSRIIRRVIARDFYSKIGLRFMESENLSLHEYLDQAKRTITIPD
jgi:hypothetical protein